MGCQLLSISESLALKKGTNSAPGVLICFPVVSHTTTNFQVLLGPTVIHPQLFIYSCKVIALHILNGIVVIEQKNRSHLSVVIVIGM